MRPLVRALMAACPVQSARTRLCQIRGNVAKPLGFRWLVPLRQPSHGDHSLDFRSSDKRPYLPEQAGGH